MHDRRFAIVPRRQRPRTRALARATRSGLTRGLATLVAALVSSALALLSGHAIVLRVQVVPSPAATAACATPATGR